MLAGRATALTRRATALTRRATGLAGAALVLTCAAALAGATVLSLGGADSAPAAVPPSEPEIVVTREGRWLPRACRPRRIATVVTRHFAAAARGNAAGAAERFAPELAPPHGWYSVGRDLTMTDRPSLSQYLAGRHEQRERIGVVELVVNSARRGLANIEVKLLRRARDMPTPVGAWNVEGKGAVHCRRRRIAVWSTSDTPPRQRTGRLCPRPSRRRPSPTIACARR